MKNEAAKNLTLTAMFLAIGLVQVPAVMVALDHAKLVPLRHSPKELPISAPVR